MIHLSITDSGVALSSGGEVILPRLSWTDYERILARRQDRAAIKLQYSARRKELRMIAPLPRHGKDALTVANLVQVLLRHTEQDWEGFDPITLKRFGEVGLEPDRCFYIHNRHAILGVERIDLERHPPPDLAIEVDATSATLITDYEALRIPEVWIYRENSLYIYVLEGGHYLESESSPTFPGLLVREWIPRYVQRGP
jgi:Uma2 family endonuclease